MTVHSSSSHTPKLGMRTTKQRTAVVEVMQEIDRFQSAKEIHTALQDRNAKVGLTTVYRTLQSLVDINAVDALHSPTGEVLYRHCESEAHHHHLVCTKCGRTEEIDGGPIEKWAKDVADTYGFQLTGHDAEVFGVCAKCRGNS
ncbi:Fur family transcriptional regulator [Corynebacterium sp. J010B-136]|uniref:Fur family transcriptional regulator n=1 Tax=Corynebacterium sp. J010B-136 TaxID=2099401 RepID=UPI000CF975DB|nr:Fur family transcriptional regulator [Corynebacterium sp. J010B-136]PQM75259.1 transcriptional repressor [Corynebacterium sp. J010B-136]